MAKTKIETPRLVLRPWRATDVDALAAALDDMEIARWMAFVPHPYTPLHARAWIDKCLTKPPDARDFAITLKSDGALIGGVSLNKVDRQAGTAGGGIWIAGLHQGSGYGREAFEAKIDFAFDTLVLTKLVNGYFDGNARSRAMQEALGYRRVGETDSRCMADGRVTIEHVTELVRGDWEMRRQGTTRAGSKPVR